MLLLSMVVAVSANSQEIRKYWVCFSDKGPDVPSSGALSKSGNAYSRALTTVSPRALERRAKVLPHGTLVDAQDLPVYPPYVTQLQKLGGIVVHEIRWMNAASVLLTAGQVSAIRQLPFVRSVEPVTIYLVQPDQPSTQPLVPLEKPSTLDYGPSYTQLQTISIPAVHDLGISGHGVLVGMFDTGFRWRAHEALRTRHVVAEHDFIFNRDTTANGPRDSSYQDEHGTLTMSVLGGFEPGQLIGAAYGVDFALAKTEYVPGGSLDYHWEEDNWAKAVEWADSLGVDIISSSLGYNTFVDGVDYTWDHGDFNGRTSVTAKAAIRAARLGIIVCNAMGNEGNGDGIRGTLLTPADADSITSVGAVDFSRRLAGFSSTGPTNDGRIKPDVVAPGVAVYGALTPGPNTYGGFSGTSLATPLTGGSTALLLSARPELTPIQVRDTLRSTADPITNASEFPTSPNNFTGWGQVNALKAILSLGPVFSNEPTITTTGDASVISTIVVSKFGIKPDSVVLHFASGSDSTFTALPMVLDSPAVFPTSGKYTIAIASQLTGAPIHFYIEARDSAGHSYQSPAPIRNSRWQIPGNVSADYVLYQSYPNPFGFTRDGTTPPSTTAIVFDLPRSEHVTITVYNVLGKLIKTILDRDETAGSRHSRPPILFDASNLPSGVYFYRIVTPSFTATRKMVLLR